MEMCYDGTLVMPSSYALMDEDEMSYIEGGGLTWDQVKSVGVGILAVCGAVNTIMQLFNNAVKYGAAIKGVTEAAFIQGVATKVSAAIGRITTWISAHLGALAAALGALLGFAGGYALGQHIAKRVYNH